MKFTLEIDCGNAAFDDDLPAEIARILRVVANELPRVYPEQYGRLRDANGNAVGVWQITG